MAKARIVVVNFNAGENLRRCAKALCEQSEQDFEVKIVDNASSDESLRYIPADERFEIIRAATNIGFAAGCNLGARDCESPFLIFLNPDAFPEPRWLQELLIASEKYPDAAMFGSLQLSAADDRIIDGAGDRYSCFGLPWRGGYDQPLRPLPLYTQTFSPCGAAAMFRTEWFVRVGGFDEAFFCYLEDVDLAFRIRLLRGRCLQVNSAVVHHVGSGTNAATDFIMYHSVRNRIWTAVKNSPGWLFFCIIPLHIAATAYLYFGWAKLPFARSVRSGIRDGLADLPRVWKQRAAIQRSRVASVGDIAQAIDWSVKAISKKAIPLREW
jgi:N-acetylglucosaminyl-diphospho-decaprenol L-rhamnosyltransferase